MTDFERIFLRLCEDPDDWALRGVFADIAEEEGKPGLAACLRWMVAERKRPYQMTSANTIDARNIGNTAWFNADKMMPMCSDPESDIPEVLYLLLKGDVVSNHKIFPTVRAAEEALFAAWAKVPAAAKQTKKILSPEARLLSTLAAAPEAHSPP